MTWTIVITVLLELFGPLIGKLLERWLKDILKKVHKELEDVTITSGEMSIKVLFDAAEKATLSRMIARRLLLKRMKAIALPRANEIANGNINQTFPLTEDELEELLLTKKLAEDK